MCLAVYRRARSSKTLVYQSKTRAREDSNRNISELSAIRLRAKRPSSLPLSSTGSSSQIFAHSTETC